MKYLLAGDDYQVLYVEDDKQRHSIRYNLKEEKWFPGMNELWDYRIGFDESEPEDSIYRYGNSDRMKTIKEITHKEAEAFIKKDIDEKKIKKMLKWLKQTELYD